MCIHPDFKKRLLLRCDNNNHNNNNIITKHSFQDGAPVLRELCKSSGVLPLGFPLNHPFSLFPRNDHYPSGRFMTPYDSMKSHKMKLNDVTYVIMSGFPFQPWDSSVSPCIGSLSILCISPHMNTFIYHILLKESAWKSRRCERHESNSEHEFRKISWRRKWQSTPVLLPGRSHGQRTLTGYSLWGRKESDTTERTCAHTHRHAICKYRGCFLFGIVMSKGCSVNILVVFWCTWACILLGVYLG